jgi:ABC-2 type transport system permease protein
VTSGAATVNRSGGGLLSSLAYHVRVVRVIAAAEFKLKYSGSVLGYVWSIVKPLGLFAMLYVVFGGFFKLNGLPHYPLYLLIGIVLWTYFGDATNLTMTSLVARGSLLSKMAFPRIVIPIAVTVSVGITFAVNLLVIAAFIAFNRIVPRVEWLVLIPLLAELYIFSLGVGLILATLFVRLRDIGQVWELLLQLLFYASAIIYPIGFLPPWSRPIAFLSPFVQVMEDARAVILPGSDPHTAADIYGTPFGELLPLSVAFGVLGLGLYLFRRQAPWFAERV